MNKRILWGVVILIIVAGASFWGGMTYAKGQTPARGSFTVGAGGAAGFAGRTGTTGARTGGGFTAGQIVASGNGSISIQTQTGSSTEIVLLSPSTQIIKSVSGTASDLTVGTSVTITGTSNSDGSMSATSIQIRPPGQSFPGTAPAQQ